ncbi:hypothetical protein BH09PLA1_BH09PLA1_13340 [soil metagenome]
MKRVLWPLCVVALFTCLATWLLYRYTYSTPVRDQAGQEVPEVVLSEIGGFAEADFAPTVQRYLGNLDDYKKLPLRAVSSPASTLAPSSSVTSSIGADSATASPDPKQIAAALKPFLVAGLRDDPRSAELLARQAPHVIDGLCEHIALLVARCAGMPSDEYLSRSGSGAEMRIDSGQRELLQYVCSTFVHGRAVPPESATQSEFRDFFKELYAVGLSFRSGSGRVVAWSQEPDGLICSIGEMPGELPDADLLTPRMSEAEQTRFYGSLSQAGLVINHPAGGKEVRERLGESVLRCHIILIVKTQGNDYYPLVFRSWYHPTSRRWWLSGANRQVSPRMATTPHLVF